MAKETYKTSEHKRAVVKAYYLKNRDTVNAKKRLYQKNNKEKVRAYHRRYRDAHREQVRAYGAKHAAQYQAMLNARSRASQYKARMAAIQHYGGKCSCCGETEPKFLAIDHVGGGGNQHLKSLTISICAWLKKQGYPSGFRILCHNCNMARGFYGECPHETEVRTFMRRSLMRAV